MYVLTYMHTYNIYMFQEHKTDMTVWLMGTITDADILYNEPAVELQKLHAACVDPVGCMLKQISRLVLQAHMLNAMMLMRQNNREP